MAENDLTKEMRIIPSKTTEPDRAAVIFGNTIGEKDYASACAAKKRYVRMFGDDSSKIYHLAASPTPVIGTRLGVRTLHLADKKEPALCLGEDARLAGAGEPVVIGTIRMGFGHYRIAMAMASAARALGKTPYWFDVMGFPKTTATKLVAFQNRLYSAGSRMSQKVAPFDNLVWEPMNSEGFRKLSYNASDQKCTELMVPVYRDLPRDVPFIGTHAWPSQAAVHAGLTHVVNAIPDNWPMALHLAEGSLHTVQTQSAYLGYRMLRGMDPERQLVPMPSESIVCTGHYIDHELVQNIETDCAARCERMKKGKPMRFLLSVGGAGAQAQLFEDIIKHLLPAIDSGKAVLFINVGDHDKVWKELVKKLPALAEASCHFGDFDRTAAFAKSALSGDVYGIHAFYDADIFGAVYSTNLLMRASDVLITKPSELAYYPVPKLMIHRVGGHEAWGAIRAAEVGDGTYEMDDTQEVLSMIDLMLSDSGIVEGMCENIKAAKDAGVYDGAYRVVELACAEKLR